MCIKTVTGMRLNILIITILATIVHPISSWAVPNILEYQGKLKNAAGQPIDGPRTVAFAIYDAAVGGTSLWQETRTVTVAGGTFTVLLGDTANGGVAFPDALFDRDVLYLGIKVEADNEMTPRQRIASSAFSVMSGTITSPMLKNYSNFAEEPGIALSASSGPDLAFTGTWWTTQISTAKSSRANTSFSKDVSINGWCESSNVYAADLCGVSISNTKDLRDTKSFYAFGFIEANRSFGDAVANASMCYGPCITIASVTPSGSGVVVRSAWWVYGRIEGNTLTYKYSSSQAATTTGTAAITGKVSISVSGNADGVDGGWQPNPTASVNISGLFIEK